MGAEDAEHCHNAESYLDLQLQYFTSESVYWFAGSKDEIELAAVCGLHALALVGLHPALRHGSLGQKR